MFVACNSHDYSTAKELYESHAHSKYSLKDLATMGTSASATADMRKNTNNGLTFAFQMYGMTMASSSIFGGITLDGNGGNGGNKDSSTGAIKHNFDSFTTEERERLINFAHTDISSSFDYLLRVNDNDETKSTTCNAIATAAMWQITYLHASSELWNAMHECTIMADPNYNNAAAGIDSHDLNSKADEFIAHWIGGNVNDLSSHDDRNGSLFSSSNAIALKFDKASQEVHGLSIANRLVVSGYETLSSILSDDTACDEDSGKAVATVESMWRTNVQLTSSMMIPLIQHLIIAMLENQDQLFIDVYAKMVVPQLAVCRHSNYVYLTEVLLDNVYDETKLHKIMTVLQDSYGCLGITCEDIGKPQGYYGDSYLFCSDEDYAEPVLAGYVATADVREQAKIDLDIHHMKILMSFENEHYWTMAKYIYMYGKNSKQKDPNFDDDFEQLFTNFRSLHSLARSDLRQGTLFYNEIVSYTDNPYYADYYIMDVFNKDRHGSVSAEVRSAIISNMILTQVIYSYVLGELNDALEHCNTGKRSKESSEAWDEVAAYIIGSLEGSELGGADDFSEGELLWSLGNKRGVEFNRVNDDGYAIVNSAVMNYLLSGKGQIEHDNCDNLERTTKNLSHMLLIPAIQTVVKYALSNQFLPFSSDDVDIYNGEIFAKFLIPIYGKYSQGSAKTLQNNMIRNFQSLVGDGPQAVADAYLDIADDFGIQCEFIGKSFEVNACLNYKPELKSSSGASTAPSSIWRLAGVSIFLVVLFHSIL